MLKIIKILKKKVNQNSKNSKEDFKQNVMSYDNLEINLEEFKRTTTLEIKSRLAIEQLKMKYKPVYINLKIN